MRILIVEDEALVTQRIKRFTEQILGKKISSIIIKATLESALLYLSEHSIDILLLDLNLSGKDGFVILQQVAAESFHTIVISANVDKALEAFEYGVLDFIGKPFTIQRLQKALTRYDSVEKNASYPTKYLSIKKGDKLLLIDIENICYVKGAGVYSEICTSENETHLHNKSLNDLDIILPSYFVRAHKSFLINIRCAQHFRSHGSGKYDVVMNNSDVLPVSRTRYKKIKDLAK